MSYIWRLRFRKLWFSFMHPSCWNALTKGVAPSLEHHAVLASIAFDLLIDVGANCGQFSLMTRSLHPHIPVHAFEPLPAEATVYRKILGGGAGVELHGYALGAFEGESKLHVSARADSSSLLPIGELQAKLFPATAEVGSLIVTVKCLDSLPHVWSTARRALLKLDVQGFELNVLRGARAALKHCAFVYVECSHISLYVGQALFPEVSEFMLSEGFVLSRRHNEQWEAGNLIQADYLFSRVG